MKSIFKKFTVMIILTAMLVPSSVFGVTDTYTYKEALTATQKYMTNTLKSPYYGSIGGEWAVIAMARGDATPGKSFYRSYTDSVEKALTQSKGVLSSRKYTEYSRVILAYTAMGKTPKNIAGYNLLKKLADFDSVKWQGINGPTWALIALDSGNYKVPYVKGIKTKTTRNLLIKEILKQEVKGGGFSLTGENADADVTAMVIQALAKYYKSQPKVAEAIDRALEVLSKLQNNDGTFSTYGAKTAESSAQVVVALTALGIDPAKDKRFIKSGKNPIDGLLTFADKTGGFRHVNENSDGYKAEVNQMATEQGLYALVAYHRFLNGKSSLYQMTDKKAKKVVTLRKEK